MEAMWDVVIARDDCRSLCREPPLTSHGWLCILQSSGGCRLLETTSRFSACKSIRRPQHYYSWVIFLQPRASTEALVLVCRFLLSPHEAVSPGTRSLTYIGTIPAPGKHWVPGGYMSEVNSEPEDG